MHSDTHRNIDMITNAIENIMKLDHAIDGWTICETGIWHSAFH
jgi:hypothetical protein